MVAKKDPESTKEESPTSEPSAAGQNPTVAGMAIKDKSLKDILLENKNPTLSDLAKPF